WGDARSPCEEVLYGVWLRDRRREVLRQLRYGGATGGDLIRRASRRDEREGISHLPRSVTAVGGVAEAEFTSRVVPRALDAAIVQRRTGVLCAQSDRDGGLAGPEVDGGEVITHLAGRAATIFGIAQGKLTQIVSSQHLTRPSFGAAQVWKAYTL